VRGKRLQPVVLPADFTVPFPDPGAFDAEGLVAIGGDLSPARLVAAYTNGIFP
jgi:leucyl/phenylalanyl-tRNA--protein transferase